MQRTRELTALGVLGILFGLIGLLYNGFLVTLIVALQSSPPEMGSIAIGALEAITGPIVLSILVNSVTGGMVLAAGIGTLKLMPWGRGIYMAAAAVTLINRGLMFPLHFQPSPEMEAAQQAMSRIGAMGGDLAVITFNALVIWYFTRPAVKTLFQAQQNPSS